MAACPPERRGHLFSENNMWYTYTLISLKNGRLYTGHTSDLQRRFKEHNEHRGGVYTSHNAPYKLIHYEAFLNKTEAIKQEKFYKSGYGKEVMKGKLELTLQLHKVE